MIGLNALGILLAGCDQPASSGDEHASPVATGEATAAVNDTADEPAEPAAEVPAPREHDEPSEPRPAEELSLTELIVVLEPGESRATMETIAEAEGARITEAVEDVGLYNLHVDVTSAAERDAILARMQARAEVKIATPDGSPDASNATAGFRGR